MASKKSKENEQKKQQEIIIELLIGLLLQKLKNLTREEVRKMIEPMLSDIKESRFYKEVADEERHEEKREIASAMLKKEMAIELITELTGLSVDEVLEISKQLIEQQNGEPV
jgi:predicted transposase YdaD